MAGLATLNGWLPLAILYGALSALGTVATTWLNRTRGYATIARMRITQAILVVSAAALFAWLPLANGLIWSQVLGLAVTTALLWAPLASGFARHHRDALPATARVHRAAAQYLLPTAMLGVVTLQLPVFLVSAWHGVEAAGQYGMSWRILATPSSLIGAAIGQVYYQRFAASLARHFGHPTVDRPHLEDAGSARRAARPAGGAVRRRDIHPGARPPLGRGRPHRRPAGAVDVRQLRILVDFLQCHRAGQAALLHVAGHGGRRLPGRQLHHLQGCYPGNGDRMLGRWRMLLILYRNLVMMRAMSDPLRAR